MKKEDIHLDDINRILFGQAPPEFLLETFVRTIITYVLLLFIVRWLGKRMSGQLTTMEMAVMLTIGAIVSVPMQVPDRGLLQGLLLLMITLGFQRGVSLAGFRKSRYEEILQGETSLLVKDGVLQLLQMNMDRISRQQLFSELRQEKIFNLGMVERLYLEAEGVFSIFQSSTVKPGLPILPPDDHELYLQQKKVLTDSSDRVELLACISCGSLKRKDHEAACKDCGQNTFVNAIN